MVKSDVSRVIYIEEKDKEDYDRIAETKPFKNLGLKEIFILALALGYKKGVRLPLKHKKDIIREEYLSDEDRSIINAIAIAETGNFEILEDKKEVYKIVEEYANTGFTILKKKATNVDGSYMKELEADLRSELKRSKDL